jgi:DNA-binding NarL/FixJ family response regulator
MKKTITSHKIKVAIVDDMLEFRKHIVRQLKDKDGISVIHDSANGLKAIEGMKYNKPDVVLTDLFMPVMDGFEFISRINKTNPDLKILVYSAYLNKMTNAKLAGCGVCGFLDKDFEMTEVFKAIFEAYKTGHYLNQYYTQAIIDFVKDPKMIGFLMPDNITLTDDDIKLIILLWDELTNEELTTEFRNSVRSNQQHVHDLIVKIKCKRIAGVFKYALNNGIISSKDKHLYF